MNSATSSGENCGAWSAAEAGRAAARAEPAKPITEKMISDRGVAWDFIGRKRKSFGASRQLIRRLYLLEHGDVAAFFGGATGRTVESGDQSPHFKSGRRWPQVAGS